MRFDRARATLRIGALLGNMLAAMLAFSACMENESAVRIEEPPADSVVFWPSTVRYAKRGDTLYAHIHGLKRRAVCAQVMELGWKFRRDTTGSEYFRVRSRFEIPAGSSCASDPTGLDTLFRVQFFTGLGNNLYLETPDERATDSVQFVADVSAIASVVVFKHVAGTGDSTVNGRFTFRNATATRPQRSVIARTLATCEIMQAAVFDHRQDTVVVKLRLIQAVPRPASVFPPCEGPRVDSIEVVPNEFNFLPGA